MLVDIRARIRWMAPLCRPFVTADFTNFGFKGLHEEDTLRGLQGGGLQNRRGHFAKLEQ